MDELREHYAKWNKPDTKRQILYDSTYGRFLVSKSYKVEWWLPGATGRKNR
jgi:hypothetical protein